MAAVRASEPKEAELDTLGSLASARDEGPEKAMNNTEQKTGEMIRFIHALYAECESLKIYLFDYVQKTEAEKEKKRASFLESSGFHGRLST